jgi:hypothetical protein
MQFPYKNTSVFSVKKHESDSISNLTHLLVLVSIFHTQLINPCFTIFSDNKINTDTKAQ